jgi:hypothetical protein
VVPSDIRRWAGFEGGALAAGGVLVGALVLVAERPTAGVLPSLVLAKAEARPSGRMTG